MRGEYYESAYNNCIKSSSNSPVVLCWSSFAGPSFNLLVGLGLGLLTQKEALLSDGLPVQLIPSVQTGFIFLICNCVMTVISGYYNKGIIPKMLV